jgi:hypothetical protein
VYVHVSCLVTGEGYERTVSVDDEESSVIIYDNWKQVFKAFSTPQGSKLIPRRDKCLRVFVPPLYLIDQLRALISYKLPSPGCLGLNWSQIECK